MALPLRVAAPVCRSTARRTISRPAVPRWFAHCHNEGGTIDSICGRCRLMVARAYRESDLFPLELRHVCQSTERRRSIRVVHQIFNPKPMGDPVPR